MMKLLRFSFGLLLLLISFTFFLFPLLHTGWALATDPGLRSGAPNKLAFRSHRSLSARIPSYVDSRIASGVAETLSTSQITATEMPVYGAFFYLCATENLQRQWEADPSLASTAPAEVGKDAIEASLRIMLDEGHAHWVKDYWGEDYLEDPNCFYRMLLIGCLTSHYQLTGNTKHLPLLRQITNDLADDFNHSPKGLLDDYPAQCFPCDVVCAIAMVKRADAALKIERGNWAKKALLRVMKNFNNELPPYTASAITGWPTTESRGCTNGFFFSYIQEIDPELGRTLYDKYAESFWQENTLTHGWREFAQGSTRSGFYDDPDSGPVISDIGAGATGLGIGAARAFGDHKKISSLTSQLLASATPLLSGRLLVPSLVADQEHAC